MKVHTERVFPALLICDFLWLLILIIIQGSPPSQIMGLEPIIGGGLSLYLLIFTIIRYFHEKKNYLIFDERGILEVKNNNETLIPWERVDFAAIFYVLTNSTMMIYIKDDQSDPSTSKRKFNFRNTKRISSYLSQYVRVVDPKIRK